MSVGGGVAQHVLLTAHESTRPYKLGGLSFIAVGVLFLSKYVLDLFVGSPPSGGTEILAWRAAGELPLAITNEVLFFAAGFLVPAVIALYLSLAQIDRTRAAAGCGLIAAVIPIIAVLDIVHGRLVYPVYGLRVDTPAVAEFVLAVYYGGLHAIGLLFGIATIVLSLAMRQGVFGRNIAFLGFAAGVFDFLGAYPETIGPILILVSQVLFAAWLLAVGSKLYGVRGPVTAPSTLVGDGENGP
jgi:hypothetical protein